MKIKYEGYVDFTDKEIVAYLSQRIEVLNDAAEYSLKCARECRKDNLDVLIEIHMDYVKNCKKKSRLLRKAIQLIIEAEN